MASVELHLTSRPEADSNASSAVNYQDSLKSSTVQSDSEKVSSDILQHTNSSSCAQIILDNTETEIISSDIKETNLRESISEGKEVSNKTAQERENVIRQKEDQYNAIAEEKVDSDVNKCESSNTSSNSKETGNQNSSSVQVANTEKELLKKELKFLQCPFTWNLNFKNARTTTEKVIANCNDKLKSLQEQNDEDDDDVEEGFEWRRFILSLTLCHEHSISGSFSEALSKILECENLIKKCQSSKKPDAFFQNVKEALLHVVHSSKCHVLVSLNMLSDAVQLKYNISRYENMGRQNMAAIFGIQSAMLMEYTLEGTKAALEYAEKAINLDGNEAKWLFLYGKILGRIRRAENFTEIPTQKELLALEQAVKTTKNLSHIVFLAQAYREAASKVFWKYGKSVDSLNHKSSQLYREALEHNDNSASVNIRCAAGLLKLPPPYRDLKKAEECIEKALKLEPNNAMANHIAGNLYERLSKFDLAEKFYKKSGELGACWAYMDMLKMKIKRDRKYNPLPELQEMLQQFTEEAVVQEIYLQMGSYLFYFKNNTFDALNYWMEAIKLDPNAERLKVYECCFVDIKTSVNLYQVIVDQIQLALEQNTYTDEQNLKLRNMLRYCIEKYPESWRQHSLKE